jgi:hypothetical protein
MLQSDIHTKVDNYQFPQQKVLCDNKSFSGEQLRSLLEVVYTATPPFTGYLTVTGDDCSLHFLFFFNGAPYAAGRYADGKPDCYTIHELGGHLVRSSNESMTISLCETDPVLLKSMLLFLQEEPAVKAPASLLDFEYIVRQIEEVGANAMIALCRDHNINFFFFRNGKATLAHYSDLSFERSEGMTIGEEMLLYAFQPGDKVQAFIFRDMITTMAEDSSLIDKESLYNLLTIGYPKNRRKADAPAPAGYPKNRRKEDKQRTKMPAMEGDEDFYKEKPKYLSILLSVESGPLQGERFSMALPCTIGRKDCDLILEDRLISRRHAEIKFIDNKLVIEDLASTNGTKVNGKNVKKKQLVPNDLITIGPANLRIQHSL